MIAYRTQQDFNIDVLNTKEGADDYLDLLAGHGFEKIRTDYTRK